MSWRDEYMKALHERDIESKTHYDLIEAYTNIADRANALEAEKALFQETGVDSESVPSAPPKITGPQPQSWTSSEPTPSQLQLQSNLAETLRQKGQLESRLKVAKDELAKARLKNKSDSKTIQLLSSEKSSLTMCLKDKVEEMKGKAKLLEEVQDEMLSLTLQMNVAEQKAKGLKKENDDLVARWMARMGMEADAMNDASKYS